MIRYLQGRIDKFCSRYVDMFGASSLTNYMHDLQAGHFRYFLYIYRNLHRHCNIALEGMMRVLKGAVRNRIKCTNDVSKSMGQFLSRRFIHNVDEMLPGMLAFNLAAVEEEQATAARQSTMPAAVGPEDAAADNI